MRWHPSLHVLSCNTCGYDLELTKVDGDFALHFAGSSYNVSSWQWEYLSILARKHIATDHSEFLFDLMFPFSTISSSSFSISLLNNVCIYLWLKMDNWEEVNCLHRQLLHICGWSGNLRNFKCFGIPTESYLEKVNCIQVYHELGKCLLQLGKPTWRNSCFAESTY